MSYEKASIYEQTLSESWLDEVDGEDSLADIEEDELVCMWCVISVYVWCVRSMCVV